MGDRKTLYCTGCKRKLGEWDGRSITTKSIQCRKCNRLISFKNGKFVKSEIPGKYNYYITITGTPTTYTDSKIMFASQEIRVGEEIFIRNKNYSGEGYVVDIDIND